MHSIADFLFPAPAERRSLAILKWWEGRRLHYNLITGGAGIFSLAITELFAILPPDNHGFFVPVVGVLVFGVLANVFYTVGPAVEITLERIWGRKALPTGPALFRMGLTFSVGLAMLPSMVSALDWGFRLVRAIFS